MTTHVEHNVRIDTYHDRYFEWRDTPGAGFGFRCDEHGTIAIDDLPEPARVNLRNCLSGEYDVVDRGIRSWTTRTRLCGCGSGEIPTAIYDARGIYVTAACDQCRTRRLSGYRTDIFTDASYWTDEPIDAE